jgi:hypothetical protein
VRSHEVKGRQASKLDVGLQFGPDITQQFFIIIIMLPIKP